MIKEMATNTKSTRLQAKQLSEISPHDFEEKYCCVLFLEDFTYDVISSRLITRTNKAKTKSPEAAIGEIVTVKGFMSKVMQIGSKEDCFDEQMKLEKALSVMEKDTNSQDTEEEDLSPVKKKRRRENRTPYNESLDDLNESDQSDGENNDQSDGESIMNDIIAKENERVKALLKARKHVENPSQRKNESTSFSQNSPEFCTLKKHVEQVDQKLNAIMDMLKSGSSSPGSSSSLASCSFESTPERKAKHTPPRAQSPFPKDDAEAVMYNETDLTKGHIPSKPALFATQRLSVLFSIEELQTCTIEPSEKSGKAKLDPERIALLFDALNKVYGENKVKKTMNIITQAIKQKCLDKVKEKRRRELAKTE